MTPSPPTRVRLGMVGGGQGAFIGQVHRLAAALDGECELVCGAFSRTPENNRLTGALCGLPPERVHTDWRQLLEDERRRPADQRMQLLVIATPNHLHVPIAEAALQAGCHVFSEKPAALSLREAQRLAAFHAEVAAYIASGSPFDKAGGYAIQGRAGAFVVKLVGSYGNVVGLPLYETMTLLMGEGYPVYDGWLEPA